MHTFISRSLQRLIFFVLSLSLILSGCKTPGQDPRYNFADGKMPRSLERVANQSREIPVSKVIARLQKEAQTPGLLTIGVIDNGFDLAHPLLVEKYRAQTDGKKLTGIGHDVMGNDSFPSANLIDPTLFAYSANPAVKGKISPSTEEPLELLYQHQLYFYELVKAGIAKSPELKDSLVAQKFEVSTIYFPHVAAQLAYGDWTAPEFDESEEKSTYPSNPAVFAKSDSRRAKIKLLWDNPYKYYFERWIPTDLDDKESFLEELKLPHKESVALWKILVKSYKRLDQEMNVGAYMNNLRAYLLSKDSKIQQEMRAKDFDKIQETLTPALNYKTLGYLYLSPLYKLVTHLRHMALLRELNKQTAFPTTALVLTKSHLQAVLEDVLNEADSELQKSYKESKKNQDVFSLKDKELLKHTKWIRDRLHQYLASVPDSAIQSMDPRLFPRDNVMERHLLRTTHPYIAEESNSASHGTHTALTVAAQHSQIRLSLIRVITSNLDLPGDQTEHLKTLAAKEIEKWISNPLVYRALQERFADFFKKQKSGKTKEQIMASFMREYRPFINSWVQDNGLNMIFHDQVMQAIALAGQEKLKVTNVSLGLETKSDIENSSAALDPIAVKKKDINFLMYEMMKFRIGQQIQEKAPQTVFVIAAGNSSKWIDAEAQSALPVDITSPWLERFESAAGESAPNNKIRNVIGAGSINTKGTLLSSFTNLIIGSRVPIIYAVGEDVVSGIKTTDLSYLTSLVKGLTPEATRYVLPFMMQKDQKKSDKNDEKADLQIYEGQTFLEVISALPDVLIMDALRVQEYALGTSAGTSMSAPNLAGMIGAQTILHMEKLGLTDEKLIYNHPEFTAEKVIERAMSATTPLRSGNIVENLRKLTGESEYSTASLDQAVKKMLIGVRPQAKMTAASGVAKSCKKLVEKK